MATSPDVPYMVHEGIMARQERTIKRLWILCIIIFLAFAASNLAWIVYESQWEVVEETTTQIDAIQDRGINIIGGGDVTYGTESQDQNDDNAQ